jgi:hypothetical protein
VCDTCTDAQVVHHRAQRVVPNWSQGGRPVLDCCSDYQSMADCIRACARKVGQVKPAAPEAGGVAEPDARHGAARKFASVVTQASLVLELEVPSLAPDAAV